MAIVLNGTTGITAPDIDVTAQSTDIVTTGDVSAVDGTFSGGVYLGGTGAANKLDDYEEGTASLTITGSTVAGTPVSASLGRYTKVGRTVHLEISFDGFSAPSGGSGNITIGGLPFVLNSSGPYNFPVALIVFISGGSALTPRMVSLRESTTTTFFVQYAPSAMNVDVSNIQISDLGGSNYIRASISYTTSA